MQDWAYIGVTAWPDGVGVEARVRALMVSLGMDEFHASRWAVRAGPVIFARIEAALAGGVVRSLHAEGIPAVSPTGSQIRSSPAAWRVKRLTRAMGVSPAMYAAEMWGKEPTRGLKMGEVELMVVGRIERREQRSAMPAVGDGGGASVMMDGGAGLMALHASMEGPGAGASRTTTGSFGHVMDLYTREGERFRIDTDKFSFDVLGSERGYSDGENFSTLALRLAGEAPGALVDDGFARVGDIPGVRTDRSSSASRATVRRVDRMPAFEVYSPWVWRAERELSARARRAAGGG
ncbi:MAG: hypothetical protein HRU70_02250 [Phycisphaeraceae bacterium]|nr:MAG: hypothetical protein HRU70_02250 [Phycisphaeraceae bacterium]